MRKFQLACRLTVICVAACCGLIAGPVSAKSKVVMSGIMSTESQTPSMADYAGSLGISLADVCDASAVGALYARQALNPLNQLMQQIGATPETVDNAQNALETGVREACRPEQKNARAGPFTIQYAACMMRMDQGPQTMSIRLVPSANEAYLEVADRSTNEAFRSTLNYDLKRVSRTAGASSTSAIKMTATGNSQKILGYTAREQAFEYALSMGGAGAAAALVGNMTRVTNTGTAWIAGGARGADIVKSFYDRFASIIDSAQNGGSFLSGLLLNQAALVKDGVPLKISTTTSAPMGQRTQSSSRIQSISLEPLQAQDCAQTVIPPGFKVTELDKAQAGTAGQSEEAARGMQEMNKALQSIPPEQREMMRKMGIKLPGQ